MEQKTCEQMFNIKSRRHGYNTRQRLLSEIFLFMFWSSCRSKHPSSGDDWGSELLSKSSAAGGPHRLLSKTKHTSAQAKLLLQPLLLHLHLIESGHREEKEVWIEDETQ